MKMKCDSSDHHGVVVEYDCDCGTRGHQECPLCKSLNKIELLGEEIVDLKSEYKNLKRQIENQQYCHYFKY